MKEIDINIEGYNVNGICVGCLNYNRKMFYWDIVKECFKLVADIDVPDGLNIQVCWECLAAVKNIMSFRRQISNAYDILIDYSRQQIFLNSPEDLTAYATTKLSITPRESTDSTQIVAKSNSDVTSLASIAVDSLDLKKKVQLIEFEIDGIKSEPYDNPDTFEIEQADYLQKDELDNIDGYSSNEDVQLSELSKRKEKGKKREKKKKETAQKTNRKLKNIPQDVIELYTMTETEMWRVRSDDIASEEFTKVKYKCEDCVLSFHSEKLRNYHLNGKHNPKADKSFPCDVCKSYLLTKDTLTIHRAKHLSAYKCKVCNKISTLKTVMTNHECVKLAESYNCDVCMKSFATKAKLRYHKNICSQEKPQCDCCGKVFANKLTLKYHLKILPQNKEKPKEKQFIPCKGCNKVFNSKKSYRAHVVIHDGVKYPCPVCGKLFEWKRNLSRHTRAHRERLAHRCLPCGKHFASRDCLNNHLKLSKRHALPDSLQHECNYCGKKFMSKQTLIDHIDWDHLKKVKYQCNVCFKSFKTAKIMSAHVNNIHEGKTKEAEGEHLCDICGKSYKTVRRLKGHVWAMHTQRASNKGYKCKLCSATFTWQTSIYKHMKIMHDDGKRKGRNIQNAVKKQEPFTDIELANRMQYFHQNITSNLNITQAAQLHQTLNNVM